MSWTVFWKDRRGGPEVRSSTPRRASASCHAVRFERRVQHQMAIDGARPSIASSEEGS
jgi:hypothetical protein